MLAGKVVGSVISTRKHENLKGNKFMIVEIMGDMASHGKRIIAIDNIGAGIGEYVLVSIGSSARIACDNPQAPVDAAIIGIIDDGARLEL